MSFGQLTGEQERVTETHVRGRTVHDLGAGDLTLALRLIVLGATHVVAIDKEPVCISKRSTRGTQDRQPGPESQVTVVQGLFRDYEGTPEVAFVSWPSNRRDMGLLRILERTPRVIYLGKNTDGMQCGDPEVFSHLSSREILDYVPDRANTLIVYGPARVARKPRGEEWAAMSLANILRYEAVEQSSHAHG